MPLMICMDERGPWPPKQMRCRNRKRFIKLMMARGLSRNEAQQVAKGIRMIGQPYQLGYLMILSTCAQMRREQKPTDSPTRLQNT